MNPNRAIAVIATLLGMYSLPLFAADTAGILCASTDKIVFSCSLATSKKIVSMCASSDAKRFYYAYGLSATPELVYPARDQSSDGVFMRSHLVYGGASGGTAYSFVKQGYKYIVYSVSGTGSQDGGVIVQRPGDTGVAKKMQCQSSKIVESQDDGVIDATLKWKSDSQIAAHGLPGTR